MSEVGRLREAMDDLRATLLANIASAWAAVDLIAELAPRAALSADSDSPTCPECGSQIRFIALGPDPYGRPGVMACAHPWHREADSDGTPGLQDGHSQPYELGTVGGYPKASYNQRAATYGTVSSTVTAEDTVRAMKTQGIEYHADPATDQADSTDENDAAVLAHYGRDVLPRDVWWNLLATVESGVDTTEPMNRLFAHDLALRERINDLTSGEAPDLADLFVPHSCLVCGSTEHWGAECPAAPPPSRTLAPLSPESRRRDSDADVTAW